MKKIYCLIGPSASGKTTLGCYFKEKNYLEIISDTTRKPRLNEIDKVHYYFRTKEEFDKLRKIEHIVYAGNHYCTSTNEIEHKLSLPSNGLYVVVTYDGYEAIKKYYPETYSIFIDVPKDVCIQRMRDRGDSEENIQKRIINFEKDKEFENINKCDYVINNRDTKEAHKQIDSIIKKED